LICGPRLSTPARQTSSARGSGSACESDGDDRSDGQGAPQGGRRVQSTPVSARAAEILRGLRGLDSRGQFHEKIGASFYNPNRQNPAVSCLMFFLACLYGARGRHHSTNGVLDNGHVECVETCAFSRGPNKSKIALKWGFEPLFSPARLDLEQACMARSACRRVAVL
jgi:hypothetical protein